MVLASFFLFEWCVCRYPAGRWAEVGGLTNASNISNSNIHDSAIGINGCNANLIWVPNSNYSSKLGLR